MPPCWHIRRVADDQITHVELHQFEFDAVNLAPSADGGSSLAGYFITVGAKTPITKHAVKITQKMDVRGFMSLQWAHLAVLGRCRCWHLYAGGQARRT